MKNKIKQLTSLVTAAAIIAASLLLPVYGAREGTGMDMSDFTYNAFKIQWVVPFGNKDTSPSLSGTVTLEFPQPEGYEILNIEINGDKLSGSVPVDPVDSVVIINYTPGSTAVSKGFGQKSGNTVSLPSYDRLVIAADVKGERTFKLADTSFVTNLSRSSDFELSITYSGDAFGGGSQTAAKGDHYGFLNVGNPSTDEGLEQGSGTGGSTEQTQVTPNPDEDDDDDDTDRITVTPGSDDDDDNDNNNNPTEVTTEPGGEDPPADTNPPGNVTVDDPTETTNSNNSGGNLPSGGNNYFNNYQNINSNYNSNYNTVDFSGYLPQQGGNYSYGYSPVMYPHYQMPAYVWYNSGLYMPIDVQIYIKNYYNIKDVVKKQN
jgi:hypothetical protein